MRNLPNGGEAAGTQQLRVPLDRSSVHSLWLGRLEGMWELFHVSEEPAPPSNISSDNTALSKCHTN